MMRKFLFGLLGTTALSGMISCKEDFDVAAPYKNITVVYGMLDANDSTHYIRIQKAFMDQEKSAIDMAKVSDSSFYPEDILEVHMKEISGTSVLSDSILVRVDTAKEAGVFFTSPNYAYRYKKKLNPTNEYRLVIINKATGDVDSGQTKIITNDTSSNGFYLPDFWLPGPNGPTPPKELNFSRTAAISNKYEISIRIPTPAKYIEGVIRFFYWEKNNNAGGTTVKKSLDFPFANTILFSGTGSLSVHNSAFYYFFRDNLGIAPANTLRYMDSICDVYVYANSEDFLTYKNQVQAQGNGITTNEIKPIYTNLKGDDIYGLFSTRGLRIGRTVIISGITFDSLYVNPITSQTGIQPEPYRGQ